MQMQVSLVQKKGNKTVIKKFNDSNKSNIEVRNYVQIYCIYTIEHQFLPIGKSQRPCARNIVYISG